MSHFINLVNPALLLCCNFVKTMLVVLELSGITAKEYSRASHLNTTLMTGLRKLNVHIFEEEPEGKEIANLNFLVNGWDSNSLPVTSANKFQLFDSGPQSAYFDLNADTGILRIARRIDRDQLCPTFQSCCPNLSGHVNSWSVAPLDNPSQQSTDHLTDDLNRRWTSLSPDCHLELNVRSDDQYSRIILVRIHIKDVNDNSPHWILSEGDLGIDNSMQTKSVVTIQISEGSLIGDSFSLPTASDADSGINGVVRYTMFPEVPEFSLNWSSDTELLSGELITSAQATVLSETSHTLTDSYFPVLRHELKLVVKIKLDREQCPSFNVTLFAIDGGLPSRNSSIQLLIVITDINDNTPRFLRDIYVVELLENARPHTPVVQVSATDEDEGINAIIKYRFSPLTKTEHIRMFTLDSITGWIHVKWKIDYEEHKKVYLTVEAVDEGHPSRTSMCVVQIHVLDENDHTPEIKFEPAYLTNYALVPENEEPGRAVAVFTVSDHDTGENGHVDCKLVESQERFPLAKKRKQEKEYFGDEVATLFKLQTMEVPFSSIYKVITASSFDRERTSKITVWIVCFDHGNPPRNTSASLTVRITDVNDEHPKFTRWAFHHSLSEDAPVGGLVMQITATDQDEGENAKLIYWLSGPDAEYVAIDENSGQINLHRALDYETKNTLNFRVHAADRGRPPMNSSATVIVSVTDVNDNPPEVPERVEFAIFENHTAATLVGKLNASDKDSGINAEVTFIQLMCTVYPLNGIPYSELVADIRQGTPSSDFSTYSEAASSFFVAADGGIYLGQVKLDRERYPLYELLISVQDHGVSRLSATTVVMIHVLDINDNAPQFVFPSVTNDTVYLWRGTKPGTAFARVQAIDSDAMENGKVKYRLKHNKLAEATKFFLLDENEGQLYLQQSIEEVYSNDRITINTSAHKPTNSGLLPIGQNNRRKSNKETFYDANRGVFTLVIIATDNGSPKLTSSTSLRILLTPPFYPSTSLKSPITTAEEHGKAKKPHGIRPLDTTKRRKFEWSSMHNNIGTDLTGLGVLLSLVVVTGIFVCVVLLLIATALRCSRSQQQPGESSELGSSEQRLLSFKHAKRAQQPQDIQTHGR